MLIEAEGLVETITPAGYVDHFESGEVAVRHLMTMAVTWAGGESTLTVVLDDPPAPGARWEPGMRVRFQIDQDHISAAEPIFSGTLRDVRIVGDRL
jgi:hypothetical protein